MSKFLKECGSCTECCKGWLVGEALGFRFSPYNPCKFILDNKCSIYNIRPNVCKSFKCEWLDNLEMPNDLKPSNNNTIVIPNFFKTSKYLLSLNSNITINSNLLTWLLNQYVTYNTFLVYYVNGYRQTKGSEAFIDYVNAKYPKYYNVIHYKNN